MYFKKIDIFGFKSFADKIKIDFESGITSIVGPNGCGKTNIVDAIKWVIGEQSIHQLRGKKMEDIIFNGSHKRKPLSMAEVALTIDNSKNILPVEYKEVTVMRRLFRSGESEYYINKNRCRLKDINELFMDTGLGVDSYSLIEQGKVEFIINSKPEEKRFLFEEAAGVTKYKARKEEALRKLEKTEQNLLRLQDILSEVKRQIGSLDYQAKKARQFQKYKEELKKLEIGVLIKNLHNLKEHFQTGDEKAKNFNEEIQKINSDIATKEAHIVSIQLEMTGKEKEIQKTQEEIFKISSQIIHLEDKIQAHKNRQEELDFGKERLSEEINEANKEIANISDLSQKMDRDLNFYEGKIAAEQEKHLIQTKELEEAGKNLNELNGKINKGKEQIIDLLNKKSRIKNEISTLQAHLENFKANKEKLTANKLKKDDQKQTVDQEELKIKELLQEKENIINELTHKAETLFIKEAGKYAILESWKNLISKLKELITKFQENLDNYSGEEIKAKAQEISLLLDTAIDVSKNAEEMITFKQDKLPKIDEEKILLSGIIKDKQRKEAEKKSLLTEIEILLGEIQNLDRQIPQKTSRIQELKEELEKLEKEEAEIKEIIKIFQEGDLESKKSLYEELQKNTALLKTDLSVNKEKSYNLKRNIERFGLEKKKLEERIKNKQDELENYDRKKENLEEDKIQEDENIEQFYKQKDVLQTELKQKQEEKFKIAEKLKAEEKETRSFRDNLNRTQAEFHQTDLELTRINVEIENINNKLNNDYQVSFDEAVKYCEGLTIVESEIEKLKNKVVSLGAVNLAAPEEYNNLQERWNFLNSQQEDLLKAKEDLHQVITKVDTTTKANFEEIFVKIQANFKAIFKKLFEGGEADLFLTNEKNILESGIDIIVQPPGKKLQNISLLSGGEKALTAIALLFAFYLVKPSPFCVLDEIDAPLDDANLSRFIHMLRGFSESTQFIIITHNKKTMEASDVIYGVTMEEFGVSKLISVKFHKEEKLAQAQ